MHHPSKLHLKQRPQSDVDSIAHRNKDENENTREGGSTTVNCHKIHRGRVSNSSHRGYNTKEREERKETEFDCGDSEEDWTVVNVPIVLKLSRVGVGQAVEEGNNGRGVK